MKVFVTGAAGYIGGAICRILLSSGYEVLGGIRRPATLVAGVVPVVTGDLATASLGLSGVDAIVHAAGLGHRRGVDQAVWRRANVDAPVNVARAALAAGVQTFVLISTAHVQGRVHEGVVSDATPENPMDDYAASKLEAEREVAAIMGDRLSIIRPVAVIGPACPGNLQLVMKLLARHVPLPFGAIRNQRSFIHADDLARLVLAVLRAGHPPAIALAAHPQTIDTPTLIRALAEGMGISPILLPFPPAILAAAAGVVGRAAMWQSLAGSFIAAPDAALALGWHPAQSLVEDLREVGRYYNTTHATP